MAAVRTVVHTLLMMKFNGLTELIRRAVDQSFCCGAQLAFGLVEHAEAAVSLRLGSRILASRHRDAIFSPQHE